MDRLHKIRALEERLSYASPKECAALAKAIAEEKNKLVSR